MLYEFLSVYYKETWKIMMHAILQQQKELQLSDSIEIKREFY